MAKTENKTKILGKDLEFYLGHFESCYAGYSMHEKIREKAAAGGVVSGILIYLLKTKEIDGALVSKASIINGELSYEVKIAKTEEEILECASSVYFYIPVLSALNKVRSFNGKVGVVGLPCHLRTLTAILEKDNNLREKIKYKIGLYCGGTTKRALLGRILREKGIKIEEIKTIFFKRRHIKGELNITFKNGEVKTVPFYHFNVYRILGFFRKEICKFCSDLTAEYADISVGDIFIPEFEKEPIKHSSMICRNLGACQLIEKMKKEGHLHLVQISPEKVFKSQRKVLIYRKNMSARSLAGRLLGYKIKVEYASKVRWNDFLAAFIVLLNEKLSENPVANKFIFKIPKFVLFIYAGIQRYLTRF
jgi:coenzyme F420-reducing hydrogenase beta subunit